MAELLEVAHLDCGNRVLPDIFWRVEDKIIASFIKRYGHLLTFFPVSLEFLLSIRLATITWKITWKLFNSKIDRVEGCKPNHFWAVQLNEFLFDGTIIRPSIFSSTRHFSRKSAEKSAKKPKHFRRTQIGFSYMSCDEFYPVFATFFCPKFNTSVKRTTDLEKYSTWCIKLVKNFFQWTLVKHNKLFLTSSSLRKMNKQTNWH